MILLALFPILQSVASGPVVGLLGVARSSRALACVSRGTAQWLLRGSIEELAASRSKALALLHVETWGREQERSLQKIQGLAGTGMEANHKVVTP